MTVEHGELFSECTCPYDGTCKHAVATVLAYLAKLKQGVEVHVAAPDDKRLHLFDQSEVKTTPAHIPSFLEQQSKPQLITILEELAGHVPAVRQALEDRADLDRGSVARLVEKTREEIVILSAEPGWRSHWNDEARISDYSGVRNRLAVLMDNGHADEVLSIGEELLRAGTEQVSISDDDGETGEEIAACMDVVFRALSMSSLSPADQMLWAINATLDDEYGLCEGAAFWERERTSSDWSLVADRLFDKLALFSDTMPAHHATASSADQEPTDLDVPFSHEKYHRDRLTDWIFVTLEKSNRQQEIIPLCEREAQITGSYVRLVRRLIKAGNHERASRGPEGGSGLLARTSRVSPPNSVPLCARFEKERTTSLAWPP